MKRSMKHSSRHSMECSKKRLLFVMIWLGWSILLNAQTKPINIQVYFDKQNGSEVNALVKELYEELKSTVPYSEFAGQIKIYGKISTVSVTVDKYDRLVYDKDRLKQNHGKFNAADIYVLNSNDFFAKGGRIDGIPIIFCSLSVSARTILHEMGHALVGLGDEYDDGVDITFSEKHVSVYPNLSIHKPNRLWEQIKSELGDDLMGYYPGGLGSRSGIYHCYPLCIMQDIKDKLCPVCEYFTRKKLLELSE